MTSKIMTFIFLVLISSFGCGGKSNNPEIPPTPKLLITLDNSTITIGQNVSVILEFKDIQDSIFGVGLQLGYDNTIVSFDDSTGMAPGDFLGNDVLYFARDVDSAIHISITKLRGQTGSAGSGAIAMMTFTASNSGHFVFGIERSNLNLYDSAGNSMDTSNLEIGSAELHVN